MTIICPNKDNFMKKCSKCKIEKPLYEFHIDKTKKDGRKTICKNCRKKIITTHLSKERKIFDRNINNALYRAIKENKSGRYWEKILGYTLNDLKMHLENKFTYEMNWNNFGSFWWINKIIPKSFYIYKNIKNNEFKKCWSLKNLRPLDKNSCIKRKSKVNWELIHEYKLYDILPIGLINEKII